jgi:hypothetical protein
MLKGAERPNLDFIHTRVPKRGGSALSTPVPEGSGLFSAPISSTATIGFSVDVHLYHVTAQLVLAARRRGAFLFLTFWPERRPAKSYPLDSNHLW